MSEQLLTTPVTAQTGGNGHKPLPTNKKWVYLFGEVKEAEATVGGQWEGVRALLGGKGAGLMDMTRQGIPVPPGFTVSTEACNAYLAEGNNFPPGMWEQELAAVKEIEKLTGKTFGGTENPLLVSCRSGAKFSMPGMMDTVLNIGLNDEIAETMARLTSDRRFVFDLYRRLIQMFGSVVMGVPDEAFEAVITSRRELAGVKTDSELQAQDWEVVTRRFKEIYRTFTRSDFPTDPYEQLRLATEAVFKSWNGRRAIDYRNAAGIAHDLGTAVNIQTMVYGNIGRQLGHRRGDVAQRLHRREGAGRRLPGQRPGRGRGCRHPPDATAGELATSCRRLQRVPDHRRQAGKALPQHAGHGVHHRAASCGCCKPAMANARPRPKSIAVDMVEEGLITKEEAVWRVKPAQVDFFLHPQLDREALKATKRSPPA
jgi:pyruvate,orthophosphate dikinase